VNVTRNFPGRGIRVWGARTISSDALWKYVSVRRLFIFIERSIYEGTQWVVFEPNGPPLWARVIDTIRLFLRTQWRLGALLGRTEEEAFFVTCDRNVTMTQDDILNGRLICEIGIAPVRPAEFVIFRIFQNTAEVQR
jgi:phage tail sheath protein FI